MVEQYPYFLHHLITVEAVFDESTATWTDGTEEWIEATKCRDEMNGGGGKITTADGEVYVFGAVVYMPFGVSGIKPGDKIKVIDNDGNIRVSGDVKNFSKGQLNSKLWV